MAKKPALGTAYMRARAESPSPDAAPVGGKVYRLPVSVQKFGFWLDPAAVESWRNAVDFLSGPPERLTLSGFVQNACAAELKRLARKHNKGRPFPKRSGPLKRGSRPRG